MKDFHMKVLWVGIPALVATGVTLFAGESLELKIIAYGVLVLVAAFGLWATGARTHRMERERDEQKWREQLMARLDRGDEVDKAILRENLVRAHREWAEEKGHITLEALEVISKTHAAYNAVGGNDTGDKLWEDIRALPIEEGR